MPGLCANEIDHGGGLGEGDREDRLRLGENVASVPTTRRKISMSNGTTSPDRSIHSRIVSAEACGVVTSRI